MMLPALGERGIFFIFAVNLRCVPFLWNPFYWDSYSQWAYGLQLSLSIIIIRHNNPYHNHHLQ